MNAPALTSADIHGRGLNVDERPNPDGFEEAEDIPVPQGQTSVGQGGAHEVLSVGSVDVDEALERINPGTPVDPVLQAFQP
jgi:hypothetical protein